MVQLAGDTIIAPGVPNAQVFTASGTWTKPSGLRHVIVEVVGGGGGSGGALATGAAQVSGSPGGGGGGYARKLILASALGASETVTVGAGGLAGTAGATAGTSGGTSSFGAFCSAAGGTFSTGVGAATPPVMLGTGGAGGTGTGGDLNIQGSRGGMGFGIAAASVARGNGGASQLGGSEPGGTVTSGAAGAPGELYGGGGHGACNGASQAARVGGDGAAGVVTVTTYF